MSQPHIVHRGAAKSYSDIVPAPARLIQYKSNHKKVQ